MGQDGSVGGSSGFSGTGGNGGGQDASEDEPSADANLDTGSDTADQASLPLCITIPACDASPPDPGPARDWKHTTSSLIAWSGDPRHRGRDLFLNPGDEQWLIGKFAYGITDKDMKDEEVDIYLLRGCQGAWEKLDTVLTTEEGAHSTVEGVEDDGGRVYFRIPAGKELAVGRHRVHMVLAGDLTATELFIEVVPPGTPVFVSDVDGTLTTEETEEYASLLTGSISNVRPDAPQAFQHLVSKGYRPFYMTARPDWLVGRTREFLSAHGLPPGIVHTTLTGTGALGSSAADFKTGELNVMNSRGLTPQWAFGNTDTDAQAYADTGIQPAAHRVFMQFTDTVYGGRRIEAYTELLSEFSALAPVCE